MSYHQALRAEYAAVRARLNRPGVPQKAPPPMLVTPVPAPPPRFVFPEIRLPPKRAHMIALDDYFAALFRMGNSLPSSAIPRNLRPAAARPRFNELLEVVATLADTSGADIVSDSRFKPHIVPRHVLCWMLRCYAGWPFTQIGRWLGHVDHTSALNAVSRVDAAWRDVGRDADLIVMLCRRVEATILDRYPDLPRASARLELHRPEGGE